MKRLASVFVPLALILAWQMQTISAQTVKADQARLQRLIADLGSDSFAERTHAAKELEKAGEPALEPLRAALKNPDAEISGRAARLLANLEQQALTNRLLAAKKVRLQVKDMSVADAISELARLSDCRVEPTNNIAILQQRKITLDTGEVTFWEALQQLCQKGGLAEIQNSNNQQPAPVYYRKGVDTPVTQTSRTSILLTDGTFNLMPVCQRGSLRIQAISLANSGPGEMQLVLDVSAETRLQDFGVVGLPFLSKIVDDHDESLAMITPEAVAEPVMTKARFVRAANGMMLVTGGNNPVSAQRSVAIRIKMGEKGAKNLKEISGNLYLQALNDPEVLVKVDGVLAAAGQSFVGKDGNTIHMQSVEKMDGAYRIRLAVESPAMQQQDPFGIRNIRVKGKFKGNTNIKLPEGAQAHPPRLIDADGKEYPAEVASDTNNLHANGQVVQNFELIYRPTAAPAQLVLHGQRLVQFSVPFTLKNVPVQ